jgi:phosphoglycerate dehydrogenase-like enzyme
MQVLKQLLPQADVVALTCPLTPETRGIINAETLALMKPHRSSPIWRVAAASTRLP